MPGFNFSLFPNLTTDRLNLRQLQFSDDETIAALRSHPLVNEFLDRPNTITPAAARQFIEKTHRNTRESTSIYWAIAPKEQDNLIGTLCLWNFSSDHYTAEIGYELHPDFQRKGIMQEAVTAAIDYGFQQLGLYTISAVLSANNLKSLRLLARNGFLPDVHLLQEIPASDLFPNIVVYALRR